MAHCAFMDGPASPSRRPTKQTVVEFCEVQLSIRGKELSVRRSILIELHFGSSSEFRTAAVTPTLSGMLPQIGYTKTEVRDKGRLVFRRYAKGCRPNSCDAFNESLPAEQVDEFFVRTLHLSPDCKCIGYRGRSFDAPHRPVVASSKWVTDNHQRGEREARCNPRLAFHGTRELAACEQQEDRLARFAHGSEKADNVLSIWECAKHM